ncbi:Hsp33 family molecular chaperone [Zhengella sp. ZM62]|uniref:Hsp33 family molecular chaperone n=1 Tax=Zhengella sedimenti TaxID=3390035 RepID=UPI003975E658
MTNNDKELGEIGHAGDDAVVPFQVSALDVRGRIVQLGPELDSILARHAYPPEVSLLLAEAVTLAVLLGTSLKFSGKFIFQTQSDGPVDMLVADFTTPDGVRAYARYDGDRLAEAVAAGRTAPEELLGTGILALTIDQGVHMQRYQGIVELDGSSLEVVAQKYFRQSEQIPTAVRLAAGQQILSGNRTQWRAGGIVAQFLPDAPERMRMPDLHGGDGDDGSGHAPVDNAWRETEALLATIEPTELWDPSVGAERLLYRLFHEHGAIVYEPAAVHDKCSCTREKIGAILDGFTADEIEESIEDGKISVTCEFCSTSYTFDPGDFRDK